MLSWTQTKNHQMVRKPRKKNAQPKSPEWKWTQPPPETQVEAGRISFQWNWFTEGMLSTETTDFGRLRTTVRQASSLREPGSCLLPATQTVGEKYQRFFVTGCLFWRTVKALCWYEHFKLSCKMPPGPLSYNNQCCINCLSFVCI